ncbi:hypothetical protein Fmac_009415 [Flemingia macrophylla]|uniref:TMV resistance protein N n=1 Tax=Flemingia macrophylla TaxID=520843 RepID=A0ABD1N061_9FABA
MEKLPPRYPNHRKGLVGIEKICEEIEPLLKTGSNDSNEVITFGIWGMGGIGKTTLANALYEKLSSEFEGRRFLANVTKKSEEVIHKDLYSKLSGKKSSSYDPLELRLLLQTEKVLIVLDDVTTPMKLEELIYQFYPLGSGSKVIVTTRNKQIFRSDAIKYHVQGLKFHHSLEIFCLTAFEEKQPKDGYEDISQKVISYCKGVPLALTVVGASLRSKSKEVWECQVNKLRSIPNMEIQKVLKLSYDDLDDSQQSIFLDIACFLKGEPRDNIFQISEIEVLLDKSLITILKDYKDREVIEMHDLIQEMGHEIVRQESIKYPEKRSRLWKDEEVVDVLKTNKNLSNLKKLDLEGSIQLTDIPDLSKATKLQNVNLSWCRKIESLNIHSEYLSELNLVRCLSLTEISVTSNKLTRLNLFVMSKLRSLNVNSRSFRELKFSYCPFIKKISVVSEEITALDLSGTAITSLPSSISCLPKLTNLDLYGCRNLVSLPELPQSLILLQLDNCKNLVSLPELPSSLDLLSAFNCISLETEMCQRLVLHHILGPNLHGRDYFAFPGDHVIDKCEFHTTKPSLSIPAACLNISHLCGFIYCIILSQGHKFFLGMSVSIYQDDAQLWHTQGPPVGCEILISDHVMFRYHDLSKFDRISEVHNHSRYVQIKFQLHEKQKYQKGFGVFPVYATTSGFKLQISESQSFQPELPSASKCGRTYQKL